MVILLAGVIFAEPDVDVDVDADAEVMLSWEISWSLACAPVCLQQVGIQLS